MKIKIKCKLLRAFKTKAIYQFGNGCYCSHTSNRYRHMTPIILDYIFSRGPPHSDIFFTFTRTKNAVLKLWLKHRTSAFTKCHGLILLTLGKFVSEPQFPTSNALVIACLLWWRANVRIYFKPIIASPDLSHAPRLLFSKLNISRFLSLSS